MPAAGRRDAPAADRFHASSRCPMQSNRCQAMSAIPPSEPDRKPTATSFRRWRESFGRTPSAASGRNAGAKRDIRAARPPAADPGRPVRGHVVMPAMSLRSILLREFGRSRSPRNHAAQRKAQGQSSCRLKADQSRRSRFPARRDAVLPHTRARRRPRPASAASRRLQRHWAVRWSSAHRHDRIRSPRDRRVAAQDALPDGALPGSRFRPPGRPTRARPERAQRRTTGPANANARPTWRSRPCRRDA